MGKTRRGDKELSKEQELKHENKELRNRIRTLEHEIRQLTRSGARTRKQFARLDLDRHAFVQDIIQEHYANDKVEQNTQEMLDNMKNTWKCKGCNIGFLEINLYTRLDGTFYYRKCNNCEKRTPSQRYDENNVTGIMKSNIKP